MPTMPLEREAAYNNWRKTFSDLQVKRLETHNLFELLNMQLSYTNVSYEEENMCSELYLMLQKRELKEERFVSLSTTVAESSSNLSLNRCHTQSTFFTIGSFEIIETRDIPMARHGEHTQGFNVTVLNPL